MPRPKKYDWDDKRDVCYKLYVEKHYSAQNIVKYFAEHFNIPISELPGRNQFHAKFREWGFPPRTPRFTAEEEVIITARIAELFNQNLPATEIHKTVVNEGWELDDYYFRKFRRKNGMMLRAMNGYQYSGPTKRGRSDEDEDAEDEAGEDATADDGSRKKPRLERAQPAPLSPEEIARREQRKLDLEAQSNQLLQTRKRRRRIRGFGHLPADAPDLPPRYSSETSLDECKAYLQLTNEAYVQLRSQYENICREMGIIKMTLCAEGQWQASKDRLVRENMHLSSVLHPLQPELEKRANALNCICSDVTKRMRNATKKITIAEANNMLGLNPNDSKNLRRAMYELLEADHFTTVFACGKERVDQMRQEWIDASPVLTQAVAGGDKDMMRAVELLAKDARKRYCDDQTRKDPSKKQWQKTNHYGPGPGPAQGNVVNKDAKKSTTEAAAPPATQSQVPTPKRRFPLPPSWQGISAPEFRTSTIADMVPPINFDLDPLLLPTHAPPWPPTMSEPPHADQAQSVQPTAAIPSYFRLAPESTVVGHHPRMWLGRLVAPNIDALHTAATSKTGAATMVRAHGVVKNPDGTEDSWLVENDDELAVYLGEAGEKATFSVVLQGGYA